MNKSTKIIMTVVCLVLSVSLCFAWINEIEQLSGRYMQFSMTDGKAVIASAELNVALYRDTTGQDDYQDITSALEQGEIPQLIQIDNFAPGSRQKFRADIQNTSDVPLYVHMVLSDIDCEAALLPYLILGTSGFGGFDAPYLPPQLVSNSLQEGMVNNTFTLMQGAEIPPQATVSVYFYVIFSETATEELSNKTFSIGSVNFLTV